MRRLVEKFRFSYLSFDPGNITVSNFCVLYPNRYRHILTEFELSAMRSSLALYSRVIYAFAVLPFD